MTVKVAFRPSLSKTENLNRFRVPSLGLPTVHSKLVTSKLTASVKLPSNLSETQAFQSCEFRFEKLRKFFEEVHYHLLDILHIIRKLNFRPFYPSPKFTTMSQIVVMIHFEMIQIHFRSTFEHFCPYLSATLDQNCTKIDHKSGPKLLFSRIL